MKRRNLPAIKAFERPDCVECDVPSSVLSRWAEMPQAAEATDKNAISIYEPIGVDPWDGSGYGAKRLAGALRAIGNNPVTVSINSPGGDFFEGVAMYNLLCEHPQPVTVKIVALAASAASVIAMAGDEIEIGAGGFLMIHNSWAMAIGNRYDMRAAADVLEPFDEAMQSIYAAKTGMSTKDIGKLMDAESWINADDAVAKGFADRVVNVPTKTADGPAAAHASARRRVEAILANAGMSRSERRATLKELSGMPSAAEPAKPGAGVDLSGIAALIQTIKSS
jgi:ATP-dependent protease ClpP protease subunit